MDAPEVVESRFESVTAYLGWDHDRLDETLCSVSSAVESGDFAGAAARYEEFELGLLRHVRIEEELLFPVFEARSGFMNGPTAVMRDEDCAISSFCRAVSGFTCSYQPSTAGLLPSGVTSVCSASTSRQTGLSTAAL